MTAPAVQEDLWRLKDITFPPGSEGRTFKIITQNVNGPCGFLCICNILILRGSIRIEPADRCTASFEYLASLIGDYMLRSPHAHDNEALSSAFSILPSTQTGTDLNPLFTGISSFRPESDSGALKLFSLCEVNLVHGWLADPVSDDYQVIASAGDYDTALDMIIAGEEDSAEQNPETPLPHRKSSEGPSSAAATSDGRDFAPPVILEGVSEAPSHAGVANDDNGKDRFRDAVILRQFLKSNSTQLTYHGLFSLLSLLSGLYAFFRNSHFAVLYVHEQRESVESSAKLWTLVTDSNFASEPAVVWESLEDVDGSGSRFVDSDLRTANTAGGDYAGRTAEQALQAEERRAQVSSPEYNADLALARSLQEEERRLARQLERTQLEGRSGIESSREQRISSTIPSANSSNANPVQKERKRKSQCTVM